MTTQPEDTLSAWKRASGIWHFWAEKHFTERKSNPFGRRPENLPAEEANDASQDNPQKHEI